jgi:hypothetical protein
MHIRLLRLRSRFAIPKTQGGVKATLPPVHARRGRPFMLTARVSSSLESCHNTGYDVERWRGADEGRAAVACPHKGSPCKREWGGA